MKYINSTLEDLTEQRSLTAEVIHASSTSYMKYNDRNTEKIFSTSTSILTGHAAIINYFPCEYNLDLIKVAKIDQRFSASISILEDLEEDLQASLNVLNMHYNDLSPEDLTNLTSLMGLPLSEDLAEDIHPDSM